MDSVSETTATGLNEKELMVDPFLVEALQNPRHRLTILRMELDIQRFLQSPHQQQLEFQHFPTSYLRLAAHRVAQHYGLVTTVQDNGLDGFGNSILVKRTTESRYLAVQLSEIPMKQSNFDKHDHIEFAIKPRPNKSSTRGRNEMDIKKCPTRSVEERKEDYDKARARIFSSPSSPESELCLSQDAQDGKSAVLSTDADEAWKNSTDQEKYGNSSSSSVVQDGGTSFRVAILRDREKDRTDPDYDRSYERYVRSLPVNQGFNMGQPMNMQKNQFPYVQYDTGFPPAIHPPCFSYNRPLANPDMGLNPASMNSVYMQWPSAAFMYAHSFQQTTHAGFQAPFCQQPLSSDYLQYH